ncbi:MAG: hypothetical protein CMN72_02255 [Sphingomonas sp.]|nr:hypothetical protein [Sphingobium sp.]MAW98469.1 hypothetical protein [Sphingomonas sp.]MCC4252141.1 helix-turn-helix domain-containing protein [Sphingobium naphthae]|tara:strand:- start:1572 stop:1769 length:198 start_codon:yes stop_codon:yes gene_type:complete
MTMQGSEFRAARKRLGWTQARMAAELDMSPTFIGLMERGERPIERRTALAVRALEIDPGSHLGEP